MKSVARLLQHTQLVPISLNNAARCAPLCIPARSGLKSTTLVFCFIPNRTPGRCLTSSGPTGTLS